MNRKSQVISIFFAVFLIIAVLSIIGLESANLKTNENISQIETAYTLTDNAYQSISNVYSTAYNLGLSPQAISFLQSSVAAIADTYMINYHLNLSEGIALTNPSTSLQPTSFVEKVPVTITNSQNAGVAPFQQMINFTSSDPGWSYMNTSAVGFGQNVEFLYSNGQVIPSWLESYNPTDGVWWIKLGSIPPSSSTTIYMGFAPKTTNLFNTVNDGEAPTLTIPVVPVGSVEYAAPITITNSQSSATPSPFQQMINVSSSVYSNYAASNLQNVEFLYQNGTVVHSWLENYTSNHAIWWINIGSIPADGSLTIYIGFVSKSTNLFNNVNIGEAPQLSPTYGEYDDGANVFVAYDNFAGTQLNSSTMGWSGYSGISVNDGLTFAPCTTSGCTVGINTAQDFSVGSETLDFYGTYATENVGSYSAARMGFLNESAAGMGGQSGYTATYLSSTSAVENVETNYYSYASTPSVWTIETYGTEVYSFRNYGNEYSETTSELSSNINFFLQQNSGGKYYFNWVRIRNSPPNGVMPSVSIGDVKDNQFSTYAEYDDGANVFNFYDNFAGTSLTGMINNGEIPLTVDNGVNITGGSTANSFIGGRSEASLIAPVNMSGKNYIQESYMEFFPEGDAYDSFGLLVQTSDSDTTYNINNSLLSRVYLSSSGSQSLVDSYQNPATSYTYKSYSLSWQNKTFFILGMSIFSNNTFFGYFNYNKITPTLQGPTYGPFTQYPGVYSWRYSTILSYWYRIRAYPPNGVMPSVSFG